MVTYKTGITLDVGGSSQAEVVAKQDDNNTRQIQCSFVRDNTTFIKVSDPNLGISSVEVRILRPDGGMVILDNAYIQANFVIFILPENALAVPGRGYGDVRLLGANGECLSAARFILTILPSAVSDNRITSSSDFRVYTRELEELKADLGGLSFVKLTQAEYDAITSPDENTVYIITEGEDGT